MCSAYLPTCDTETPETTEEKRKAAQKHKQSVDKNNDQDPKETHFKPLLRLLQIQTMMALLCY